MNLTQIIAEHRHNPRELAEVVQSLIEQARAKGWLEGKRSTDKSRWLVGVQELADYLKASKRTASRFLSAMRANGAEVTGTSRKPMIHPDEVDRFLRENPSWRKEA